MGEQARAEARAMGALMANLAIGRTGEALAIAGAAALAAMLWPPASLLVLALLAARALAGPWRLPRLVDVAAPLMAALCVGLTLGLAAGIGMLFVWRVIADTRWSLKEEARLAAIAGVASTWRARAHLWLTPLFAATMVAFTAPHMVAGLPLDLPHVPIWVPLTAGVFAALALFDWMLRRAAEWRLGQIAVAPAAHQFAHHALFLAAYATTFDVSAGLVALFAWRLAYAQPRLAHAVS